MEEFDYHIMSPDDCVELVQKMNEIVMRRLHDAAESGDIVGVDRAAIVQEMVEVSGLDFDDIMRFAEIGEYIILDRETRDMDEEESARWKLKREAVIALIDSLIEQAVDKGVISRDQVPSDETIEMLEEMWRKS